ncbi:bifunctional GMP synthase/glutamine amidotransferase protein [Blattabacterium sp. (Mastotermes darwiniensis) str. MADAR]|uniref:glutamine-hydrolyzing GMP synthase n=1 Tax=Blattabacterium sp. (Mastotermes darwiniensis) TaxID=39768 RepID=UPI000231DDD1|nr:glutamine-hydrolyzing GMP synthase [Blattabacterium sp. (Mastotermes darwiniensis)]AER40517.1 bifunctional GMP synthase/glutamine amidotransferase protein [Blattabacterium sp. (Mastotermes darwiniensis) str. MADAR]
MRTYIIEKTLDYKDFILVLDFGSQYSQIITRKIREIGVYALLCPYSLSIRNILSKKPKGIILSGGPFSVYEKNPPLISRNIFQLNIPILGICYGMQLISFLFGGEIEQSKYKEYGKSNFIIDCYNNDLFHGIPKKSIVWMSHFDEVKKLPKTLKVIGHTSSCSIAALIHEKKDIYAVQFHPEVSHTEFGISIMKNFILHICKCNLNWKLNHFVLDSIVKKIRKRVDSKKVILGFSGGIDSFVAAHIIHKAIGDSLHCIFVDTGLLLKKEKISFLCKKMNLFVKIIDAKKRFLSILTGITDPEMKRKIIGKEFISIFQKESEKIKDVEFLAQGTIYSDVIESSTSSSLIKSHHNVGGLPHLMKLKLLEPLKYLFKDEVRKIGKKLGIPKEILYRHPFPGPGLSIRILGEVNQKKISILKKAESILLQELKDYDLYESVSQAFIILLPIKSVGVMGDKRTYEYTAVLRVTNTEDFMTATFSHLPYNFLEKISNRIINEVDGINRLVYDITSKPPATIEWE